MPTIIVNVEYHSKSVFGWEGLPVEENMDIDEFYQNVVIHEIERELWDKNVTAFYGHTRLSEKEKIGLKCKTWETAMQYGKYVTFKLKDDDYLDESTRTVDAFELMRIASTTYYLPEFNVPRNSFNQLRIDLCEWIKINGGGWIGKDNANVIGKKFITDLSKSIWYVDSCSYKTMDDRFRIPEIFTKFFDRAHPENHKKARKSFNSDELQNLYKILMNYLELPWMSKSKFSWLKEPLQIYTNNLLKYSDYLIVQKATTLKNQNFLVPIVDEGEAAYIEILDANT